MGTPLKQKVILGAIGLAVVAMLFALSREPSVGGTDNCQAKGIDPEQQKEGTCEVDGAKEVVVDRVHTVRLQTLDARIEGMRKGPARGSEGGASGKRILVSFDLRITNRTDSPQEVGQNQAVLLLGAVHGEDIEAERDEADSFLAADRKIPPHGAETGTVTFLVAKAAPKAIAEHGNLDIGNFGPADVDYEPERIFEEPELGVIRTYR